MSNNFDIKQGSVTFRTQENKLDWSDGEVRPFMNLDNQGNSILIFKDSDNVFKVFHVYLGKGRTDLEWNPLSSLHSDRPYFFAVTWDTESSKKISLYVDGEFKTDVTIPY